MINIKMFTLSIVLFTLIISPAANAIKLLNAKSNNTIQQLIIDEANHQNIDPTLALAIAEVESNFNPLALSSAGAKGVMQIMPATAKNVYGISSEELFNAKTNIRIGVSFIKKLLNRYSQQVNIALSHYNGGSAVQNKFGYLSVIPATQKYVNKVLSAQKKYIDKTQEQYVGKLNLHRKALPATKSKIKNVMKPENLYSSTRFNHSLYQKMEHLRTLRLHNIMRNTQNKSLNKTPVIASTSKPYTNRRTKALKKTLNTQSEKRKKVLRWEAIFD